MQVKLCGLTSITQVYQLMGMDVDYVGLNFYQGSPRCVQGKISAAAMKGGDFGFQTCGVFVNHDADTVCNTVKEYGLQVVQLHGSESPEFCNYIRSQVKCIKAFPVDPAIDNLDHFLAPFLKVCDYFLFDSPRGNGGYGGTGRQFNWNVLRNAKIGKPFFLAGGITGSDTAAICALSHPHFFGVDINSGFENAPGIKDIAAVGQFSKTLKSCML